MKIENISKECTGCSMCKSICPVGAIEMREDQLGFLYPSVDHNKCIKCGLCEKKCPVINLKQEQNLKKAYYGRALDKELVLNSSSGGIVSVLYEEVLKNDGVVFGAVFDKNTGEIVYKSSKDADIDELRRSKYVASNPKDSYIEVKKYLDDGIKVFFCGMPCHIAGLKAYLGKDYENLVTCDFICGGGASPKCFKEHLEHLSQKYKSKVKKVNFRPKIYGWGVHGIKIEFENGKQYTNYAFLDSYFRGFVYEQIIKRYNCYDCKFKSNHVSDIIVADFWGFRQIKDINNDDKGLSLILINSDKGDILLKHAVENKADIKEILLDLCEYNFKKIRKNDELLNKRERFIEEYNRCGFEKAAKRVYMKKCGIFRLKSFAKKLLKYKSRR